MAKSKPETISLLGEPLFKEGGASAAINPGHLIEFGGAKDLRVQSTAKKDCQRSFALENDLLGKTIADPYSVNENVRYGAFHAGQEVYARLPARAAAVVKGDSLEASGDGTLRKLTDGAIVAVAIEAVDNSGGNSEQFIKVEVA